MMLKKDKNSLPVIAVLECTCILDWFGSCFWVSKSFSIASLLR